MDTKPHAELPPPTCPKLDAAIRKYPEHADLLEEIRMENSQLRYGAWHAELEREERVKLESLLAEMTARAERAERERDEAYREGEIESGRLMRRYNEYCATRPAAMLTFSGWINKRVTDAEAAEAELAAVHKRLDAISEEDRMTRNANSLRIEGGDGYDL